DVVEVDLGEVTAPGRHRPLLEVLQRLEAVLQHPVRLALHPRHLADDLLAEPLLGLVDVVLLVGPAELVAPQVEIVGDCHGCPPGGAVGGRDFSYGDSSNGWFRLHQPAPGPGRANMT